MLALVSTVSASLFPIIFSASAQEKMKIEKQYFFIVIR